MAAPSVDSQPIRIPLATLPEQRSANLNLDAKVVNAFIEKQPGNDGVLVGKRPGLETLPADNVGDGVGRGIYYWSRGGNAYHVTGDLLRDEAFVTVGTVNTSGPYWFNETLGTPYYMYLSNGAAGYTLSSAGVFAQIVDPDYPAATVPGSAYLDGTLYVMDEEARIWGTTGLNNPTSWSATNMIRAQIEPDRGVAIAKQLIYVIALKEWTTEVFYDAGNPTGSPLLPVQNAKIGYGCANGYSVQSLDDKLYWVATARQRAPFVVMLDKLRAEIISTPQIERLLQSYGAAAITGSWIVRVAGHTYYGIQYASISIVYDADEKAWYYWTYEEVEGVPQGLPVAGAYQYQQNYPQFQGLVAGRFFQLTPEAYRDASLKLPVEVVTPNFDGGVRVRKVMSILRVIADQNSGGQLAISWSDDDYKTWSPWAYVNLQDALPYLSNLGTFYKRAFKIRHSANAPLRLQALEPELMLGSI